MQAIFAGASLYQSILQRRLLFAAKMYRKKTAKHSAFNFVAIYQYFTIEFFKIEEI